MKPFEEMEFHPQSEKIVEILKSKTQNTNPLFYQILVGYYFAVAASMMRIKIKTHDRGTIPVNMYAINLAPSGAGKGYSMNILENEVMHLFRDRFMENTFSEISYINLNRIANERSLNRATDAEDELAEVTKEFNSAGSYEMNFDSATVPAVKQLRHKLILADIGSLNLQIDEIGSNLLANQEVLDAFLELYDVGLIKNKLIKNSQENVRNESIFGRTPANMLLFGTPSKLLDGTKTEDDFYSALETGYARRSFSGYIRNHQKEYSDTDYSFKEKALKIYDSLTNKEDEQFINDFALHMETLADPSLANKVLTMSKDVALLIIEYRLMCEQRSEMFPTHDEIRRSEMSHRFFKTTKLAGAYAFIDGSDEILEEHLYNAIKLSEASGDAFNKILTRQRNHEKLALYIAESPTELTHADLVVDLPFFKGSVAFKNDLIKLAIAWGYKQNIIIKKIINDGIEFLSGETLKKVDPNNIKISVSDHMTYRYTNFEGISFKDLRDMVNKMGFPAEEGNIQKHTGLHWVNHHFIKGNTGDGSRNEGNVIEGFNVLVFDIDNGTPIDFVKAFLKDYEYIIYTTKSHTEDHNRFRLILLMNYELKFDDPDYKEFMKNIAEWLPFETDTSTFHRSRKWLTNDGEVFYNEGNPVDVLPFIPKTSKNEERRLLIENQSDLDNVERWFIDNSGEGNRNNMLHRYALVLLDAGANLDQIEERVKSLNSKMPNKLDELEISTTILKSISTEINNRGS